MANFGFGGSTGTPSFGFGTSTSTSKGFGFGTTTSTAGFGLGASTSTTGSAFGGFAAPSTGFGGGFGSTATTNTLTGATGQGSFGFGAATTSTPSANFGFGSSFATPASTSGSTLFSGFGQTSTAGAGFGSSTFGFGAKPATTTASGFGSSFGTSGFGSGVSNFGTSSGFGNTGSGFGTGSAGFGSTSAPFGTGVSGFGSSSLGFGTSNTGFGSTGTAFGGGTGTLFGGTSNTGFGTTPALFGSNLGQQQPQQNQITQEAALYNTVFNCTMFNDERDATLARWNLIQAMWGVGKGYYATNMPPVEYTPQNPFCRFKAISYNRIPTVENKDGHVIMILNQKESYVKENENDLVNRLNTIFGNRPDVAVTVESIRTTADGKCQIIIYVQLKGSPPGCVRRLPATDLVNHLQAQKIQLQQLSVENLYPQVKFDKDQLQEYLDNPPPGIDQRLWKQGQIDNPNPEKFVPVPVFGFTDANWRMKCQEAETKLHQAFLDKVSGEIADLQRRHSASLAKIAEFRRKSAELQHDVLRVLVKQEISRKMGLALLPEEETLRSQFTQLHSQLNSPNQLKARLKELLEKIRNHKQEAAQRSGEQYVMDPAVQDDIRQFLLLEQNGMTQVISTVRQDLETLKTIKDGMHRLLQGH